MADNFDNSFSAELARLNSDVASSVLTDPTVRNQAVDGITGEVDSILNNEIIGDLTNMSYLDIAEKYGPEVAKNRFRLNKSVTEQELAKSSVREAGEVAGDTLRNVTGSAAQAFGSLVGFGGRAVDQAITDVADFVNPRDNVRAGILVDKEGEALKDESGNLIPAPNRTSIGPTISQGSADFNKFVQSFNTDSSKNRQAILGGERKQSKEANILERDTDLKEGVSKFTANKDLFIREFDDELGRILDNPGEALDVTAQGVGSLFGSAGPLGKATKLAQGAGASKKAVSSLQAVGVGVVEAQGTHQQTMEAFNAISEEDFFKSSKTYRDLRNKGGYDHNEARNILANAAANSAFNRQLPLSAVLGLTVGKFEAAPFASKGIGESLKNIGSQTVEETLQSSIGQLSQGSAIERIAQKGREVIGGVGSASAQGAVGGFGAAGVVQSPSIAAETGKAAGTGLLKTLSGATAGRRAKDNAQNPLGTEATSQRVVEANEQLTQVVEAVQVENTPVAVEQGTTQPTPDPELQIIATQAAELADPNSEIIANIPDSVRSVVQKTEGATRLDVLNDVVQNLESHEDPQAFKENLFYAIEEIQSLQEFALKELPASITSRDDSDPAKQAILGMRETIVAIAQNPSFSKAVQGIAELSQDQENIPEMTDANVNEAIILAKHNPTGVNPDFVDLVLEQRGATLPETVKKALSSAAELSRSLLDAVLKKQSVENNRVETINSLPDRKDKPKVKPRKSRDIVRNDINVDGLTTNTRKGSVTLPSLQEYFTDITKALASSDGRTVTKEGITVGAQEKVGELGQFAQHMVNKINAINESADNQGGRKVSYDTLTSSGFIKASHKRASNIFANPKVPNSVATATEAHIDAQTVVNMYNNLIKTNPDQLSGPELILPALSTKLTNPEQNESQTDVQQTQTQVGESPSNEETSSGSTDGSSALLSAVLGNSSPSKSVTSPITNGSGSTVDSEPVNQEQRQSDKVLPNKETIKDNDNVETSIQSSTDVRTDTSNDNASDTSGSDTNISTDTRDNGSNSSTSLAVSERITQLESKVQELTEQKDVTTNNETKQETTEVPEVSTEVLERNAYTGLRPDKNNLTRFNRAFSIESSRSLLARLINPLKTLVDAMGTQETVEELINKQLPYEVSPDQLESLGSMLSKIVPELTDRLNNRLDTAIATNENGAGVKSDKGFTVREILNEGQLDFLSFRNGKALNLLDTETGKYDSNLIEQALIASVDWILNLNPTYKVDERKAGSILGIPDGQVTTEMMKVISRGSPVFASREDLARNIVEFWGAKSDSSVTMSDTRGIPEALASEILAVMSIAGKNKAGNLLEITKHTFVVDKGTKDFNSVTIKSDGLKQFFKEMGPAKYLLKDIVSGKKDATRVSFGEPHKEVAGTYKRNKFAPISELERSVLKRMQQVKYVKNTPFVDAMKAIGLDTYSVILGSKPEDVKMNINDRSSIEGKNRTITQGFERVIEQSTTLDAYASKSEQDANDVGMFYNWYFAKNGRLFMEGFGPQADKTAREAFVSTTSVLDMENNEQHIENFWLSVGQSAGIVKPEKRLNSDAVQETEKTVYKKFSDSITIMRNHLKNPSQELTSDQKDVVLLELADTDAKTLHAVLAVAGLENAREAGTLNEFKHNLSFEYDGITNGPMNAIVMLGSGQFTSKEIELYKKGGFFVGETNKSYDSNITDNPEYNDLYEYTADVLKKMLVQSNKINNTPVATAMFNFIDAFGSAEFDSKTGDLVIGRNQLKNPLTVTVYGSGLNGLTNKISSELERGVYTLLSEVTNGDPISINYPTFDKDVELLFGSEISGNLEEFTFSPADIRIFRSNVKELFAKPMKEAISVVMTEQLNTMEIFQNAALVQSLAMQELFAKEVKALRKEKLASGELTGGEQLSQKDYDNVYDKLRKFGAIVQNNHQTLDFSLASKNPDSKVEFARTLDNQLTGPSSLPAPSQSGVKPAPLITMGFGDAMMINNIIAGPKVHSERALPVFDGFEVPADMIDKSSSHVNGAVDTTWNSNPARDVLNSYQAFLRAIEGEDINLSSLINPINQESAFDKNILPTLVNLSDSIDARIAARKRIPYSVDQMAGASKPFNNDAELEGEVLPALQKFYLEELSKIKEDKANKEPIQKADSGMQATINEIGSDHESGVKVTSIESLDLILDNAKSISKEQRQVYNAVKNVLPSDLTIVFGSSEQLTNYRDNSFPDRAGAEAISEGQIDLLNRVVYIGNTSPETLIHEMIHATTVSKVLDYYTAPERLSNVELDAVERLEALMSDFNDQTFEYDDQATQEAAESYKATINQWLTEGTDIGKAAALNEFMAWSLTNKNLIEVNKNTQSKNPLARLGKKAVALMKRLMGSVNRDVFSNVLFNTQVLLQSEQTTLDTNSPNVVLNQFSTAGNNPRLAALASAFDQKVGAYIRDNLLNNLRTREEVLPGIETMNKFIAGGFSMNIQEQQLFRNIQLSLATSMKLDPRLLTQLQKVYDHAVKNLSPESFLQGIKQPTTAEFSIATKKFNTVLGADGFKVDSDGRTNLMSSFLALAQTNEEFRQVLNGLPLLKNNKLKGATLDETLTNLGNRFINELATSIRERRTAPDVVTSLDILADQLSAVEADSISYIEEQANALLSRGDSRSSKFIKRLGDTIFDATENKAQDANTIVKKGLFRSLQAASSLIASDAKLEAVRDSIVNALNSENANITVREFVAEINTRNDNNGLILDMINKVKYAVDRTRQTYREVFPTTLAKQFTRELSKSEWSQMHQGLGKTDFSALISDLGMDAALEVFRSDSKLQSAVREAESQLRKAAVSTAQFNMYAQKADDLAEFMVNGITNNTLLRNATAISKLFHIDMDPIPTTDALVKNIDSLVSLYAIQKLDPAAYKTVQDLLGSEKKGIKFSAYSLHALNSQEIAKIDSDIALYNHYKGNIPSEGKSGQRLVLASDTEFDKLTDMGYTRVDDANTHINGVDQGKFGYYFSSVAGKATYVQGALQTVQRTVSGIDPVTGRSLGTNVAGMITDPRQIRIIARKHLVELTNPVEMNYLPIFAETGEIIGYERSMGAEAMNNLDRNTHFGEMVGAWAGRLAEERVAAEYNKQLVDNLKTLWDSEKSGAANRADEYFNILDDTDDKVIKDIQRIIPRETREYMAEVFGEDGAMVRRDLLNFGFGYRQASVRDIFTGDTRINSDVQKLLEESAMGLFGKNAYKYFVKGEKLVQNVVSTSKNIIVIRSGFVPLANVLSNQLQLLNRGVDPRTMVRQQRAKLVEIDSHLKGLVRRNEIQAELLATKDNNKKIKLNNEIKALDDADKRSSINTLIEHGEFSTIAEGLTQQDTDNLIDGNYMDSIEALIEKAPTGFKTATKYAVVARDTALYQGMSRAVQYGDFLAKAVYFDYLTQKRGLSEAEALGKVTNEFVNYNLPEGRVRSYAESMGLTWFWNFKIRTMKVALNLVRENPLRSLIAGLIVDKSALDLGSPITDNFVPVAVEGRLEYSIGHGMLFNSIGLNPWVNMIR